jgi:hypothetical protein
LTQRRQCTPKTRIAHRAYDAATILHIFAGLSAHPRTCRLAPRSPLPSDRTHARADTHDAASPAQHNGTSASWRVSPNTVHANKPRTAHRTLQRSIERKPRTALHAHRRAHATHNTAHSSAHPRHHPQKITHAVSASHSLQNCQAAQRRRDAARELVVVQVQKPARHTNSHRVTPCHPTPTPTASRPRIA